MKVQIVRNADKVMKKNKKELYIPKLEELENEIEREKYKLKYKKTLKSTINTLIIVVAISSLLSTLLFPVLKIYGKSMTPTLIEGDIVLCVKKSNFEHGDIIAFYYNNRILIKRVIGVSSDWINIDEEGNVYVNDILLEEPYIEEKSYGETDIEYPYQVPENSYFVLGDSRSSSIDSRNSIVGTIPKENVIGEILIKLWPIKRIGITKT